MISDNDEIKTDQGSAARPPDPAGPETPAFEGLELPGPVPAAEAAAATPAEPPDPERPEPVHGHGRRGTRARERDESGPLHRAEAELAKARQEIAELKDRYLRMAADLDNQRKRMEREKAESQQFALADVFKELLSVLDNFERALLSTPGSGPGGFQEGIGLIHKQLLDLMRKRGVTPIEAADAAFDPTIQQAIVTEASAEVEEPRVAEELQRGYRLHDRLLRPALVKVLIPGKD